MYSKSLFVSLLIFLLGTPLSADENLEKITLRLDEGYSYKDAGFIVALEKGYYREAGLDVRIKVLHSADDMILDVLSKKVNYGVSYSSVLRLNTRKAPVQILVSYLPSSPLVLITSSSISSVAKLRGKKVMFQKSYLAFSPVGLLLRQFNINAENTTYVTSKKAIETFINGDVDALVVDKTEAHYWLEKSGIEYNIMNPAKYGFKMPSINLYANKEQTRHERETNVAFINASNKGWIYALAHQDEVVLMLSMQEVMAKPVKVLHDEASMLNAMMQTSSMGIGTVHSDTSKHYTKQLIEAGFLVDTQKERQYTNIFKLFYFVLGILALLAYVHYRQKREIKDLEKLSTTDKLTQLYNRLKIDEIMNDQERRFFRYKEACSIIMIDIDYFKQVNDKYGHNVGDSVLKELAGILLKNIRNTDFLGRWGGEEFIVICPNSDVDSARILAEKLRERIEAHSFKYVGKKTASFGISEFRIEANTSEVIADADANLYQAKHEGRNRVCC